MPLSNDDRGWIMTALSGVACIFGASFICVDILVRQFPGQRDFKIQDSDTFLSVSLSLSFGVMLFSALYKMLPSSKSSLMNVGFSSQEASWILIACFMGGVVGIQVLSRAMHSFMSHEVVDCEHSHEDEETTHKHKHAHEDQHDHDHDHVHSTITARKTRSRTRKSLNHGSLRSARRHKSDSQFPASHGTPDMTQVPITRPESHPYEPADGRTSFGSFRPSLHQRISAGISSLTTSKDPRCSLDEPCYGFSEVCGSDCFRSVSLRGGSRARPEGGRSIERRALTVSESSPLLRTEASQRSLRAANHMVSSTLARDDGSSHSHQSDAGRRESVAQRQGSASAASDSPDDDVSDEDLEAAERHHHHVPTNAFLSIGLQTSIAIALHKLPEGFITYATNHANPQLGFSVFLALFIHNITEGFALALPLYLAINNRFKAMVIAFVLGGLSQPLGAGVAALWFRLAGSSKWAPSDGIYGGMFAVTAGIMASVALQLFSESMDLTHSRQLCMTGAFIGMFMMGVSSALTA